ncbi:MAG: hypothetical protein ABIO05_04720, partial [Ferruginibacter sp.]
FNAKNGDAVYVESLTDNWCKIRLPGGLRGFIPAASITQKNFLKITATSDTRLLDAPGISAAAKVVVPAGSILDIVGNYFEFSLVTYKNSTGWLPRKL